MTNKEKAEAKARSWMRAVGYRSGSRDSIKLTCMAAASVYKDGEHFADYVRAALDEWKKINQQRQQYA
jgi:hypothetical protein